jgi:hypothetical protein
MIIKPAAAIHPRLRFPAWQSAYEEMLQASDINSLFKLVEVAESAILIRRDLLKDSSKHKGERRAIEEALRVLMVIKEGQLMFPSAMPNRPS